MTRVLGVMNSSALFRSLPGKDFETKCNQYMDAKCAAFTGQYSIMCNINVTQGLRCHY